MHLARTLARMSMGFLLIICGITVRSQPLDEGALDRVIVPRLVKGLDGPMRRQSLLQLVELGPYARVAVPGLVRALKSTTDPSDRVLIADALGRIHDDPDRSVPALVEVLKDTEPWVANVAFRSLAEFGEASTPAVPAMIERLKADPRHGLSDGFKGMRAIDGLMRPGPAARAALAYYENLITSDDDEIPASSLNMALEISSGDPVAISTALQEMEKGSLRRRCDLAYNLSTSHLGVPPTVAETASHSAALSDEACRKRWRPWTPQLQVSTSHPQVKIRLSISERKYFAGEVIPVTPSLASMHDRFSLGANPKFIHGEFIPEVRNSAGASVDFSRAPGSLAFFNMMANGITNFHFGPEPYSALGESVSVRIPVPGHFRLIIQERAVHVDSSTGPVVDIYSDPVDVVVVAPSDEYVKRQLAEIEPALASPDVFKRAEATEKLRNMHDARALPLLVRALEDEYKNVIGPAMYGLLEYQDAGAVAREVRRAIAAGRPATPGAMRWYADVLARTERGWPKRRGGPWPDAEPIRVDGAAERWRLLLMYRQETGTLGKNLTPAEIVKALEEGFIDSERPDVCRIAFQEILARDKAPAIHGYAVIQKCGSKRYIPELWEIAHGYGRFDPMERNLAYLRLNDLGEKKWMKEILADAALGTPSGQIGVLDAYSVAMQAHPRQAAKIIENKLVSRNHAQVMVAVSLLKSFTWPNAADAPKLPLNYARIRTALLNSKAFDEKGCTAVAFELLQLSPPDALALIEGVLKRESRERKVESGSPLELLVRLSPEIAGASVRRRLHSADANEAAAMAQAFQVATRTLGAYAMTDPILKQYFPDLLVYYQGTPNGEGRENVARAMNAISDTRDCEPNSDPVQQKHCVEKWKDWLAATQ